MKMKDIRAEFEKYIVIKDPWILDMVLATLVGNALIDRDPLWTMIVAPSSGGKTTMIAPCVGVPSVFFVDDLTEKTLLSGYKVKGKEASLLKIIGSGILAFSDFTSILSKNPNSKGEILTQLKLVYDRKITKHTGTGGIQWEGKIGFIGAATPDIYYHMESGRSMGERFLYYWMEQPTDGEVADKQSTNTMSSKQITDIMQVLYKEYIIGLREWIKVNGTPDLMMTPEQRLKVREASIFCVNGKATVHTNFKTGKVDQIPNKAGVGRDNKAFDTLLHTMQLMDAYENDNVAVPVTDDRIKMVQKCAYSSINRERRKVLEILSEAEKPLTASEIGTRNGLGLEKDSVELYLAPLHAVGLVTKKAGNPHKWGIENDETLKFIREVSGSVIDNIPKNNDTPDLFSEERGTFDEEDWSPDPVKAEF